MKEIDPINLAEAGFAIAKAKQEKEMLKGPHSIKKKWLRELRKEAKALGFKVIGKYGKDGQYHIYLKKGSYERQAL